MLGHDKILKELKKLREAGELQHAYIFFGPEGVGKRTAAARFAAYLEKGDWDYEGILSDALIVAPGEKGSLGIDESRRVKEFLGSRPAWSQFRTVIIDGGEALTEEAQNALLKIAEEPPPSALIFLISKDLEGIGQTLVSRFEKIYFGSMKAAEIESWLKAKKIPVDKAKKAAEASFGRPGLAIQILENGSFAVLQKQTVAYLNSRGGDLKATLKSITEEESFSLPKFLDMIILQLAWKKNRNLALWHKVLELRHTTEYFSLNPRIQLENLHSEIK